MFAGASMSDSEKETLRKDLSDYCSLDTLAMVRLVDALRSLSGRGILPPNAFP